MADGSDFPASRSRWRLYAYVAGENVRLHEVIFGLPVDAAFVVACCAPDARRRLRVLGYADEAVQAALITAARVW